MARTAQGQVAQTRIEIKIRDQEELSRAIGIQRLAEMFITERQVHHHHRHRPYHRHHHRG